MNAESITVALGGRWGGEQGVARCPAHDDRHPSLSLRDGRDGRLLVKCHAGCDWRAVLDALRRGLVQLLRQITGRRDPRVVLDRTTGVRR
jgi:hypothetical protein